MLDRPQSSSSPHKSATIDKGVADRDGLVRFLVNRQFNYLANDEANEEDEESENYIQSKLGDLNVEASCVHVGFNGRWNKKADTCYAWWVCGTLAVSHGAKHTVSPLHIAHSGLQMVDRFDAVNIPPSRQFLLDITQHQIGGFSKYGGGPPDLYHSYLGLGALALMGEKDLKAFDCALCCSKELATKIELAREGLVAKYGHGKPGFDDDGFWDNIK